MALWSTSIIPAELRARYSVLVARVDDVPKANVRCRECEQFVGRTLNSADILPTIITHEQQSHAKEKVA